MYFADFYCTPSKKNGHCVNIVLAKQGTDTCDFCERYLIKLDRKSNPFCVKLRWTVYGEYGIFYGLMFCIQRI